MTQAASDAVSKGVSGASTAGAQIFCSRHHRVPETTSRHRTTGWPWVLQTIESGADRTAKPHCLMIKLPLGGIFVIAGTLGKKITSD
jgi:hypothetical protein